MKKIALVISSLFEPMAVLALIGVLGGIHAGLTGSSFILYGAIVLFGMIAPVIGFRLWYMRRRGADWDLTNRKKRLKPLLAQVAFAIFDILIISAVFRNADLALLFILFFVWITIFFLVTIKWKISGHAGTLALATGLVVKWFGPSWWPVLLLVPIVGWSRVVKHDHTIWQVVAGALYSWVLVYFFSS